MTELLYVHLLSTSDEGSNILDFEVPNDQPEAKLLRNLMSLKGDSHIATAEPLLSGLLKHDPPSEPPSQLRDSDDESDEEISSYGNIIQSNPEYLNTGIIRKNHLRFITLALSTTKSDTGDKVYEELFTTVPPAVAEASNLEREEYCASLMLQLLNASGGLGNSSEQSTTLASARNDAIVSCLSRCSAYSMPTVAQAFWGVHLGINGKLLLLHAIRTSLIGSSKSDRDPSTPQITPSTLSAVSGKSRRWTNVTRAHRGSTKSAPCQDSLLLIRTLLHTPADCRSKVPNINTPISAATGLVEPLQIALINTCSAIAYSSCKTEFIILGIKRLRWLPANGPDSSFVCEELFSVVLVRMRDSKSDLSVSLLESIMYALITLLEVCPLVSHEHLWSSPSLLMWSKDVKPWVESKLYAAESTHGEKARHLGDLAGFVLLNVHQLSTIT